MRIYTGTITHLEPNQIFVFGSNTQGRHGKGAALTAMTFGANYGQSRGLQGRTYAIVTKDLQSNDHPSITPYSIITQIKKLYEFAFRENDLEFLVAYKGTGTNLNGYTPKQMAYLFSVAARVGTIYNYPENIVFEEEFSKLLTI